jgi:anti-sigma regulatory factor (Ser/Thr protein kinase)
LFGSCRIGHPLNVEYRLSWEAESSRTARQLASDFAEDWLPKMEVEKLALMVSEVVTNAVKHGSPEADGNIGLRIEGDQDALRVVVTDGGHDFAFDPGSIEDSDRNEHFGLLLVDRLADRWGLSLDGKKAIWLEVDTPRSH